MKLGYLCIYQYCFLHNSPYQYRFGYISINNYTLAVIWARSLQRTLGDTSNPINYMSILVQYSE